jgi:hypothetical protein
VNFECHFIFHEKSAIKNKNFSVTANWTYTGTYDGDEDEEDDTDYSGTQYPVYYAIVNTEKIDQSCRKM